MVTRPKGDNMIKRAHTEHLGFCEVGFAASVLTNELLNEGRYNMYWSNEGRYIGVVFPNVMYRMFECVSQPVFHSLFKTLSEVRAPLGAPGRSSSIINSIIDRIVGCPDLDDIELVEDAATDYVPEFFD